MGGDGRRRPDLVLAGPTVPGRTLQEYEVVGLSFAEDRLYALVAGYDDLLRIDPATGRIERAWSLDGVHAPSGIAVRDGVAYITQDHEYSETPPGVAAFVIGAER